jgi:hypothetical protein
MTKHNYQYKRYLFGAENGTVPHRFIIEAGVALSKILVCLRGAIVISGGTSSGTSQGENPGGFMQNIQIDATAKKAGYPGGKLKNVVPRSLVRRRIFDSGFLQPDQLLGASGVSGAAATFNPNMPFQLRFSLPYLVRPLETALRLDNYSQIMMKITNGSKANQVGAAMDRTMDYTGLFWDIIEFREFIGDYQPPVVLYEDDTVIPIAQTNARTNLDPYLSHSEAFLDVVWIAETSGPAYALTDGIINEIFVKSGSEQFLDFLKDHCKAEQQEYLTDFATVPTGLLYTPFAKDLGNDLTLLSGAVPDIGATLDITKLATDQLTVSSRRIAPVPKQ